MKKRIALLMVACMMAGCLWGCSSSDESDDSESAYDGDSNYTSDNATGLSDDEMASLITIPDEDEMAWPDPTEADVGQEAVPTYYLSPDHQSDASETGDVVELKYTSALTSESGDPEEKSAMVYLPYGYSDDKQYNIMYLMHGMGASNTTFLGEDGGEDGGLKQILDHAIEEGKIEPIIVVAPELGDVSMYDESRLDCLCLEIRTIVMPLVESTYSTYAESTDHDGLEASRDHRCFGGFSMGGCITWRMLWNYTDYFRYYIPCSMIADFDMNADVSGETFNMCEKMAANGYNWEDYSVFCATGSEDYCSGMTNTQVEEFLKYTKLFKTAENDFTEGNLMFRVWEGRVHRYYSSFDYFYNGLMLFFPGEEADT